MKVTYQGKRKAYADGLYGTGEWEQGQTKEVPTAIATKMLKHPDVYVSGGNDPQEIEVVEEPTVDVANIENTQEARDLISAMTDVEQVKQFVTTNFGGQKLHHLIGLEKAKQQAIALVDQYGMP